MLNKRLVVTQSGATIIRGRIYEQEKHGKHKTRLTIKCLEGGFPTRVTVPDSLLDTGCAKYKGVEFKIY